MRDMPGITLLPGEIIVWKGRESLLNSFALLSIVISIPLLFFGAIFSLYTVHGLILLLLGIASLLAGFYDISRFSTYIITNTRLIEIKYGRPVKEVSLRDVVGTISIEELENVLDVALAAALSVVTKGLLAVALRISTIFVKNGRGRVIFTFRRVRVKDVKDALRRALLHYARA